MGSCTRPAARAELCSPADFGGCEGRLSPLALKPKPQLEAPCAEHGSRRIEYEIINVEHAELGKQLTELDGGTACRADENGLKPRQPRKLRQKIAHGDKQQNVDDDTLQRLGAGNMENRKVSANHIPEIAIQSERGSCRRKRLKAVGIGLRHTAGKKRRIYHKKAIYCEFGEQNLSLPRLVFSRMQHKSTCRVGKHHADRSEHTPIGEEWEHGCPFD